jgi:hypothetical protein
MDQGDAGENDSIDEPGQMGSAFSSRYLRRGNDKCSVSEKNRPNFELSTQPRTPILTGRSPTRLPWFKAARLPTLLC